MRKLLALTGLLIVFVVSFWAVFIENSKLPAYVALGDSVAAGAGLNPDPVNNCNQAALAYPYLVAADLHYRLIDLACAGATVPVGIIGSQGSYSSQLIRLFSISKPKLITITVGANDINWMNAIVSCYKVQCTESSLPAPIVSSESALLSNLKKLLSSIFKHYGLSTPTVVLTGYYQPVSATADCPDIRGAMPAVLSSSAKTIVSGLNNIIRTSTSGYSFAHFAPVSFSGHGLCTPSPWIQGVTDRAPYHPTSVGQSVIAASVENMSYR